MKKKQRISITLLILSVIVLPFLSFADDGKVVGTQCWINGKLVGGFPPGYTCPGTGSRLGGRSAGGGMGSGNPAVNAAGALGNAIGQELRKSLFGDPEENARREAAEALRAAEEARVAEIARQEAEAREAARKAEEARKRQATYDRLRSELQLSEGFSSNKSDLPLILGDSDDGLRPQGTSFFGSGGGTGRSKLNNDSKVVDLRPRQGYSAAAPASPGETLSLIMGDPNADSNVVDLRDKKAPLVVDPRVVKGEAKPAGSTQASKKPIAISSSGSFSSSQRPIINSNEVDLRDVNQTNDSQGLMKHQWEMSIDWRYRNDPVVQQYIHQLWASAFSSEKAIQDILSDQMRANGRSPQQVDEFFGKVKTFLTGDEPAPRKWEKASSLARELDAENGSASTALFKTEKQLAKALEKAQFIKAEVSYMAPGPQTRDDCVLHAIANGAQVPLKRVNEVFEKTAKGLGMEPTEVRHNPNLVVTNQKQGGRGGLSPLEELLVADQLGDTIAVPRTSFARAISTTGSPVVTTVTLIMDKHEFYHEVVVTGVYRTGDGSIYYAVMDSNLAKHKNFTQYVEKYKFEESMPFKGGYVVIPKKKP